MNQMDIFSPVHPLLLVGCGHMGNAMARGWIRCGLSEKALIGVNPSVPDDFPEGAVHIASIKDMPVDIMPAAIVLAVKPAVMDGALQALERFRDKDILVISVAAGVRLDRLKTYFKNAVRAMPNTPSAIGRGITVAVAGQEVSTAQRTLAGTLLGATGTMLWIEDEGQMDAVTAVSGSGPAYIFAMTEAMAAAGRAEGLPIDVAQRLARETVIGAAHLLERMEGMDPATLRKQVTSPGGTTAAALDVLMGDAGLEPLLRRAISAATRRSRELAG